MNKNKNKKTNSFKNIMADCHCDSSVYCKCTPGYGDRAWQSMDWTETMRERAWSGVRPWSGAKSGI